MRNGLYGHADPEKMTSMERLERIVEILVKAGIRLAEEEKALKKQGDDGTKSIPNFEVDL